MREVIEVELTKGYRTKVYADTWDRLKLGRFAWKAMVLRGGRYVYAVAYCGGIMYLHRLITEATAAQNADHINGDTLDNRDDNLRACAASQNSHNRKCKQGTNAGLKGVSWSSTSHKWAACITVNGWRYYLGLFEHKRRAGVAVDRAALALQGEFAHLNFPGRCTRPKMPTGGFALKKYPRPIKKGRENVSAKVYRIADEWL